MHLKTNKWTALFVAGLTVVQGCQSNAPSSPAPLQTTPIANSTPTNPDPVETKIPPQVQVAAAPEPTPAVPPRPVKPLPAPSPVPSDRSIESQVVARLRGEPILMRQLIPILVETKGLAVLLNLVQLEATKQEAARQGITVSPEEIKAEFDMTLAKMFGDDAKPADYEALLTQFLEKENVGRPEFSLVMENNAYLRKLALHGVEGKITDEILQEAFRQMYGEKIQVRHIELANMQEVLEVQQLLKAGQPFDAVARLKSHNARTAPLGGELPPFTRTADYEKVFKDVAFTLKEGEVSEPVGVSGTYQLIKAERRIPPSVVKFEDVKAAVREDVLERYTAAATQQLRALVAENARRELIIDHPVLKDQYGAKLQQRDTESQARNTAKEDWERRRAEILKNATSQESATQPSGASAAAETSLQAAPVPPASGVAQPPATQSVAP